MTRVYGGPDVMSEIAGWRHFLYGAGDGVAEELAAISEIGIREFRSSALTCHLFEINR